MSRVGLIRTAIVVGAILALELSVRTGLVSRLTVLPPSEMVAALAALMQTEAMWQDVTKTLSNVVVAAVLSIIGGFALGVGIHALPPLRRALDPFLASYYAVPFFVFYPIMIVVFGMNDLPIIAIGFMFAVVAMIINTLNGLDRIPRALVKTARVLRMGRLATAVRVKLPAAAPHLFTGAKLAVAYSFIGVIASEFILANSGIGYSISYAYNNFDNRTMYALMLFVITLVTIVNGSLHYWEQAMAKRRGR